jgi:hypothetical protein
MNSDIFDDKQVNPEDKLLEINFRWRRFSERAIRITQDFILAVRKYVTSFPFYQRNVVCCQSAIRTSAAGNLL